MRIKLPDSSLRYVRRDYFKKAYRILHKMFCQATIANKLPAGAVVVEPFPMLPGRLTCEDVVTRPWQEGRQIVSAKPLN